MLVALPLQLIIGFESGIVVLWDLKSKKADYRYTYDEVCKTLPFPFLLEQLAVIPSPSDLKIHLLIQKLEIQSHIKGKLQLKAALL